MGPKRFMGKPKRFGWRSPQKATTTAQPKPRSYGWRAPAASRQRMIEEELPRQSRDGKYLLAPCLVLWAAVWGTRAAFHSAMEHLPFARSHDFQGV
jgi:hypothetical protein